METAKTTETEPMPGTSQEPPAAEAEKPAEVPLEEVIAELTAEEKEDEPDEENINKYFKKYVLTGKGKGSEEKIQEASKEINYQNLVVLIAIGDYIVNKAKNIKEVAKKWGLSFSVVQRAMSHKKEHSVGGRQYAKRKRAEKQEGPTEKANDWKRNRQQNQPESKAHSQQNKAKTPRTAGSYQMYLGHELEVPEEEVRGSMEY